MSEVIQMETCEIPREEMLPAPVVRLSVDDPSCDFDCVRHVAIAEAKKYGKEPELASWLDKRGGRHSQGDECCVEGEPTWLAYAEARRANLTIDINHGDYIFMFHQSEGLR